MEDKENLTCSFCGQKRHTKDTCFKLIGYPDWYEGKRHQAKEGQGKGATATGVAAIASSGSFGEDEGEQGGAEKIPGKRVEASLNPYNAIFDVFAPSEITNCALQVSHVNTVATKVCSRANSVPPVSNVLNSASIFLDQSTSAPTVPQNSKTTPVSYQKATSSQKHINSNTTNYMWILDSRATDTMTNNPRDFETWTSPTKTHIETANGELIPVSGGGTVSVTPNLHVHNCLYVPSLSSKFLSISQITRELHCVLMYPTFCLLQDIRSKAIIGQWH